MVAASEAVEGEVESAVQGGMTAVESEVTSPLSVLDLGRRLNETICNPLIRA